MHLFQAFLVQSVDACMADSMNAHAAAAAASRKDISDEF